MGLQKSDFPALKAFKLNEIQNSSGIHLFELRFDLPGEKVNKLGQIALGDFEVLLPFLVKLGKENRVDALVVTSGKPGQFIAGADIQMIQSAENAKEAEKLSGLFQNFINDWEDLPFVRVMAIDGPCMGGGCEWALGSSAILMSNDSKARIALPEVQLGLLPGGGGCLRLPVKVGLATALDMILTGKTLSGESALKAGLVEGCLLKEDFHTSAFHWVEKNLSALKSGKRLARDPKLGGVGGPMGSILEKTFAGRNFILKKAREGVLKKTRGKYPAPVEILNLLTETGVHFGKPISKDFRKFALAAEAKGFGKLAASAESKALIQLFFLMEEVKKSSGLPEGKEMKTPPVKNLGVLGAGVMGGGIAQLAAEKDIHVRMKDIGMPSLNTGMEAASKVFAGLLKRRKLNKRQVVQKLNLISPTLEYEAFSKLEVIIEAVVENIDVKKKVFAELEGKINAECVVASNTSSLSISEMQKAFQRSERFVGMHFFNPVSRMPLIEVIRGEKTNDRAVATIFNLSKQMGKTPIVVKDAPGFLVNRLLMIYLNEAIWLADEGYSIKGIDETILDFGMPMGPFQLLDEIGIDVADKVAHILHGAFGDRMAPASIQNKIIGGGKLGKKNGKGFYLYDAKGKSLGFDDGVYKLLGKTVPSERLTPEMRNIIVDRCMLPMVNEAALCLEENIVESAGQVDLGMIMGTGFPPFRGGICRYADNRGLREIVDRLGQFEKVSPVRFKAHATLVKRAESHRKFYAN